MRARDLSFFATVSLIGLIGASPAFAQSAAGTNAAAAGQSGDETDVLDTETTPSGDVVVTGFRSAETKEIAEKRSALEITDGISSDDLGRIPDLNIGEAMQRIPGIQLNRDGEGREASVTLRGLPGEYARTTMNGVAFAEPILQGSTPFGAYLSDVFSGVRVEKSQLAHSIAGGLSGNIDLQIAPALSRKDGFRIKAALDYNELDARKEPNFSVGLNKHITDNLAIFGTVAYKREDFRRDSVFFNAYGTLTSALVGATNFAQYLGYYAPIIPATPTSAAVNTCLTTYANVTGCQATAGGTGAIAQTGVQYVNQTRQYMRYTVGEQYSASGGVEWKIDDKWRVGVVGLYTNRNQKDTTQTFQTLSFTGVTTGTSPTRITPTSPVVQGANGTYFVENFDFSNVNNITDNRILPVVQRAWGVNPTIDYEDDNWKLKTTGTYSKAFSSTREMYISLSRNAIANVSNGITGSFNSGAGNWDNYKLVLNDFTVPTLTPKSGVWSQPAGVTGTTASNYFDSSATTAGRTTFRITGTQANAETTLAAIQQDFERKLHGGLLSAIQGGLRFERNEYTSAGSKVSGIGINPTAINDSYMSTNPDVGNFFDGSLPGASAYWKVVDVRGLFDAVGPASIVNPLTSLNELGLYNEYADDANVGRYNFTNTTDVMSAYIEAKVDTEILSMPLKGAFGVRYEATTQVLDVLSRLRPYSNPIGCLCDFSERTLKNNYDYFLPSGILILEPARNLLVRAAAYQTYVRPHPRQFSPVTLLGAVDLVNQTVAVTLGNPDLEPYTGTSFDLSLEWYNRPGGIFAVNFFQKRFKGLIQAVGGAVLCPADGGGLGFGPLQVSGNACIAPDYFGAGEELTVNITGNANSSTPITVRGVEVNVKQNLDFLPGILRNLGGGVTYGYNEISGTLPTGQAATLAGVAKHNVNLIGYYETKVFGVRLTYNYRSDYDVPDQAIFGFGGLARRVQARGQLDGSATLNLTKGISLNLSAFNITNSVRREYQGIQSMARRIDYDGRTYRVAVNAKF